LSSTLKVSDLANDVELESDTIDDDEVVYLVLEVAADVALLFDGVELIETDDEVADIDSGLEDEESNVMSSSDSDGAEPDIDTVEFNNISSDLVDLISPLKSGSLVKSVSEDVESGDVILLVELATGDEGIDSGLE
jgi:hypothetical protein